MPSNHDLGIAFALTAGAGFATAIGAAIVFFPSLQTKKFLASSLAFASGVMLYVSFVEIFVKSLDSFEEYFNERDNVDLANVTVEDYIAPTDAYHCATACFFGGLLLTWVLDKIVTWAKSLDDKNPNPRGNDPLHSPDIFQKFDTKQMDHKRSLNGTNLQQSTFELSLEEEQDDNLVQTDRKLLKTALIAGVSVTLHNFPEGLATFFGAAEDPAVGAALAIAIGIHNIPEGIVVSVPIYMATGNKWRAFFWGVFSGIAETIAGAIGWIALATSGGDISVLAYAILFGLVGGMMVYICFRELLPTAWKYDPDNERVTIVLFMGFVVMAASLMLFQA